MQIREMLAGVIGIGAGIVLHVYARSGNGWEVGPGTLVGVAGFLAGILGGAVCVVLRKRQGVALSVLLFSIFGMGTLLVLSWLWPPSAPGGPVPITRVVEKNHLEGL